MFCCSLFLCRTHFLSLSPFHSQWFGWLRRLVAKVWRRCVSSHCRISTSWTFMRASSKMQFLVSAGRSKNDRCSGPPSCLPLTSSEYLRLPSALTKCPKTLVRHHWFHAECPIITNFVPKNGFVPQNMLIKRNFTYRLFSLDVLRNNQDNLQAVLCSPRIYWTLRYSHQWRV